VDGGAEQTYSGPFSVSGPGAHTVTFWSVDNLGVYETPKTLAFEIVSNSPPVADPNGPYAGLEGAEVSLDGSGSSDPDGDDLTYSWDFGDGTDPSSSAAPVHVYADNGTYDVCLTVTDPEGLFDTQCTTAVIDNVAPVLGPISAPTEPVPVGTEVTATAEFTDAGILDTHTALWGWGDESGSDGTVTQGAGFGSVEDSHTYTEAGVFTLTLTVTDDDGGAVREVFEYVVVYDPEGGFVTGGGWIDSPEGAYLADPGLTGKATFGFVSKYKRGTTVPTGNTEFQFKAGNLNFHSDSYEWLVVTGSEYARFKGAGTVNGMTCELGDLYNFQVWAGDGSPDTFRIRIWCEDEVTAEETDVYDNGFDQGIGGGSVVIHTKG
jgi:PKD repeat protein